MTAATSVGAKIPSRWRRLWTIALGFFLLLVQPISAASQTEPQVGPYRNQGFVRPTSGVLAYELVPSFNGTYKSASFRTNRWGMRDKDYALKRPPSTYRIALLGASFTMGAGVPEDLTHESLLENRLNRDGPGAPRRHYEILNFAVGGYGILQNVVVADRKVFPFAPNAVLLVIHGIEPLRMIGHLSQLVQERAGIEYPYVRQKLQEAGVRSGMLPPELERRLVRVAPDLIRWSLQRVAEICREHGVPLVVVLFSEPREQTREARFPKLAAAVAEAGIPLVSLAGAYEGYDLDSMKLQAADFHLNALGHRVVADRLYELLRANDARTLKLGFLPPR